MSDMHVEKASEPQRPGKAGRRLRAVQDRSRERHDAILRAFDQLLQTEDIENLSHADIAIAAGIPKPVIYYHYPTISAIQLELGGRYDHQLTAYLAAKREMALQPSATWQERLRSGSAAAREWFNDRRAACECLLGPSLTREHRLAGLRYNNALGASQLRELQSEFVLPARDGLDEAISCMAEIHDMFWSRSYLLRGFIDDEAYEQSMRASVGYLRNFLPDHLPRAVDC